MNKLTAFALTAVLSWTAVASTITWTVQSNTTSDTDVRNEGRCLYAYTPSADQVRVNGVEFARYSANVSSFATDAMLSETFSRYGDFWGSALWTGSDAYKGLLKCGWYNTPARNVTLTLKGLAVGKRYLVQIWMCDVRGIGLRTDQKLTIGGATGNKEGNGYGSNWVGTFTAGAETETISLAYNNEALLNAFQVRCLDEAKVEWKAFATSGEGDVRTEGTLHCACKAGRSSTVNGVTFTSATDATVDFGDRLTFGPQLGSAHTSFCTISDAVPAGAYSYSENYRKFVACGFWQAYVDNRCIRRNMTIKGLTPGLKYLVQLWSFDNRHANYKARSVQYDDGVTIMHGDGTQHGHGSYAIGTFTAVSTEQTVSSFHAKGYGETFGPGEEMVGPIQIRCLDARPGGVDWRTGATAVDGSVDVRGRPLYAYCCNATTVSGTEFAQVRSLGDCQTNISISAALSCADTPFVTETGKDGLSDAVVKLLKGAFWGAISTYPTIALTLHNLKPGRRHLVQIWACDQRSNGDYGRYTIDGVVTVSFNGVPDSANPRGQWATGTFVAGSPDQAIVLSNCQTEWKLNAVQVRVLDDLVTDPVSWTVADITTDAAATICTEGTLCYAFGGAESAYTANGVRFDVMEGMSWGEGKLVVDKGMNRYASFYKGDEVTGEYRNLLACGLYDDNVGEKSRVYTLKQLSPGKNYLVQYFVSDSRDTNVGRRKAYLSDGQPVRFGNNGDGTCKLGQYAIGRFRATAESQSITIGYGDGGVQVNAIQVRDLGWDGTVWTGDCTGSWSTAGDGWTRDGVSLVGQTVWDAEHGLTQVADIPGGTALTLAEDVFAHGIASDGEIVLGAVGTDKILTLGGSIAAPKATINFPWKSTLIASAGYGEKKFAGSIAAVKYIVVGDGAVTLDSAPAQGVAIGVYAPGTLKVSEGIAVSASSVAGDGVYSGPGRIDLVSGDAIPAPSAKPCEGLVWGLLNGTSLRYPDGFDFSTTTVYLENPATVCAAGTVVISVDGTPVGKPILQYPAAAAGQTWLFKWSAEKSGFVVVQKPGLVINLR